MKRALRVLPRVTRSRSCAGVSLRPATWNHTTNRQPSRHREHPQPRAPVINGALHRGQARSMAAPIADGAARFTRAFALRGLPRSRPFAVAMPADSIGAARLTRAFALRGLPRSRPFAVATRADSIA